MTIVLVDEDKELREGRTALLRRCEPAAEITAYATAAEALEHVRRNPTDVVFIEAEPRSFSGFLLARQMKAIQPKLNVIFLAENADHTAEAMEMHASGYLIRPFSDERVRDELNDLRYPVEKQERGLYIRAFGSFEVFYDGEPVWFRYRKSKELLAYLVDRKGAIVSRDELITVLWGGETDRSNYYKQITKDLKDMLDRYGLGYLLIRRRGYLGLLFDQVACDYRSWLAGTPTGLSAYHGEYMRQYDWAEETWMNIEGRSGRWSL